MNKIREAFESQNAPCGEWVDGQYTDYDEQTSFVYFASGYRTALELVEIAIERLKDGP